MRFVIALIGIFLSASALAQTTQSFPNYINSLPAASTLTGAESIYVLQSGDSRKATVGSIFANGIVSTLYVNAGTLTPSSTYPTPSALGIYEIGTVSGSACSTSCKFNSFQISLDSATVGTTGTYSIGTAWNFLHTAGTSGMVGDRATVNIQFLLAAKSGNTTTGASYSALLAAANASVNDNGTGVTAITSRGQVSAINFIAQLSGTATDFTSLQGGEIDVKAASGTSTYAKSGLQITQLTNDAVAGTTYDAALAIANQPSAVGWSYGISFGGFLGQWPFSSGATVFGCPDGCGIIANFIDFTTATISGNFLSFANGSWSGAGAITSKNITVTGSTAPSNGMYLSAANTVSISANNSQILTVTGSGLFVIATNAINPNDKFALASGLNGTASQTIKTLSSGSSAQIALFLGNVASNTAGSLIVNGDGFSGGLGANAFSISGAGGLWLQGNGTTGLNITAAGVPQLPNVTTGTPTASLCLDASNNIIKKTTSGACI